MDSVDYYNKYAARVYEDTVDVDMSEVLEEFLGHLEEGATILDLGCGSGRDTLTMYEMGYDVTPLDGSEEMCKLAEIHTGLDVLQMDFEDIQFDDAFDGIWACGSLLHVPKDDMPAMLERLSEALCRDGILYISVKKGEFEGIRGERYFSDYLPDELKNMIEKTGLFTILRIWESDDQRGSHAETVWVNLLAKKR